MNNNLLEQMDNLMLDIKILKHSLKECYNPIQKKKLITELIEKQEEFKLIKDLLFERLN